MTIEQIIPPGSETTIVGEGFGFTEGPAADAEGNVYFSDGQRNSIHILRTNGSVERFTDESTDAIGMMFNTRGELCVCEGAAGRIVAYNVNTREKRILCAEFEHLRFNEPNDLAVDRSDGFFFSDPNYQHHGQPTVRRQDVYYCTAAGEVSRVSTICFKPNGVLLSADDRTLYVADARGQRIYRYDVTPPGVPANERLWIDGIGANPDGLTLDEHDNLYVCCGKGGLKIYDRHGRFIGRIDVHAANVCFGGPDFRTLAIASSDKFRTLPTLVAGLKPLSLRDG